MDNILNMSHHIQCMYLGSLITEHGRSGKGDQEKNNDGQYGTDHIHQHENTIVSRHKPEDQIKANEMLCLVDTILWGRDMDNYKISVVQT